MWLFACANHALLFGALTQAGNMAQNVADFPHLRTFHLIQNFILQISKHDTCVQIHVISGYCSLLLYTYEPHGSFGQ